MRCCHFNFRVQNKGMLGLCKVCVGERGHSSTTTFLVLLVELATNLREDFTTAEELTIRAFT